MLYPPTNDTDPFMTLRSLTCLLLPVLLLGACRSSRPSGPEADEGQRYDEAYAMTYLLSDPHRSLSLIDSAFLADDITDERRQYLRAVVMYTGLSQPDSSLLICRHLVESDAWGDVHDTLLIVDVYRMMATAASTLNRYADVIHYAQLAYDMAHGNPMLRFEESDLLSRVGRTMAFLGQKEEGLRLIERAYSTVGNTKSWPEMMTSVNIGRKMANTLQEMNRPDEALQTIRNLLHKLDYFSAHSHEYADLQPSMVQNADAVDSYVNYMRVRCYAGMIKCFALTGARDSARHWLNVMDNYQEADDPLIVINLLPALVKLHFDDMVTEDVGQLLQSLGSDTLNLEYVRLLEAMSDLERHHSNWKAASDYMVRASVVRDSVEQESFRTQLTDQLTLYQLHDEHTARMDAEAKISRLIFVSASLSLFLMLMALIGVVLRIFKNFKRLKRVHDDTRSELQEAIQQIEQLQGAAAEPPEALYARILNMMEKDKPYTDPDFDIVQLATLLHTNRTYISKVINKMSGQNFRMWLAKYRVTLVQKYMKENPEASVNELCVISGYGSRSSLYRHFKAITGQSPIGWMTGLEETEEEDLGAEDAD